MIKKIFIFISLIVLLCISVWIYENKINKQLIPAKENTSYEKPITETIFEYNLENDNNKIKFSTENITFELTRKDDSMETNIVAKVGKNIVFSKEYGMSVNSIFKINFQENKLLLINFYTGGAHCCSVAVPYFMKDNKFVEGKGLYLGNVDIYSKDNFFIKDNRLFTNTYDDRFAYFETCYASSGSMFFPTYYELTMEPLEFVNRNELFVDEYLGFYKEAQQGAKEMITKDKCNQDEVNKEEIFGSIVYRYSMGYFAKSDRNKLKNELKKDWWCFSEKNFKKIEEDIYQALTENNKSEDFFDETFNKAYEEVTNR